MKRIRSTLPRTIFEIQSEVREQIETRDTGTKLTTPMSRKPQLVDYGLTADDVLEIRNFDKTAAACNDIPGTQWLENILPGDKHGCLGELVGYILVFTVLWPFFLIPLLLSPITSHFVKPAAKPIHPKKQKLDQYCAAIEAFNRSQQSFWRALSGVQFEKEVAALLRKHGHDVQTTPYSGDEGIDLIMDREIIIQCKAHSKPVSPATVRELLGSKQYFKASKAILIASCGCTTGATAFAKKTDIDLWDISHLIELQEQLN